MHAEDVCLKPTYVGRDNDTKFTASFDEVFKSADVIVKKTTPVSPNLNAHIERFVQIVKQECLDHFLIVGEKHLNHIWREFLAHYLNERSHSSRDHLPPAWREKPGEVEALRLADVACETRLGGLLKHYWRRAAWRRYKRIGVAARDRGARRHYRIERKAGHSELDDARQ
jgi:putative transposase